MKKKKIKLHAHTHTDSSLGTCYGSLFPCVIKKFQFVAAVFSSQCPGAFPRRADHDVDEFFLGFQPPPPSFGCPLRTNAALVRLLLLQRKQLRGNSRGRFHVVLGSLRVCWSGNTWPKPNWLLFRDVQPLAMTSGLDDWRLQWTGLEPRPTRASCSRRWSCVRGTGNADRRRFSAKFLNNFLVKFSTESSN